MLCMFLQTINNEEDERAFEELYKKYSKKLLAYAIGKLAEAATFRMRKMPSVKLSVG